MNFLKTIVFLLLVVQIQAQERQPFFDRFDGGISVGATFTNTFETKDELEIRLNGEIRDQRIRNLSPGWSRDVGIFGIFHLNQYFKLQMEMRFLTFKTKNEAEVYSYFDGVGLVQKMIGDYNQNRTVLHLPLLIKGSFGKRLKFNPLVGIYQRGRGVANSSFKHLEYNYASKINGEWIPNENGEAFIYQVEDTGAYGSLYDKLNFGWIAGIELQLTTQKRLDFTLTTKYQRGFKPEGRAPLIRQEHILIEIGIIHKNKKSPYWKKE